jgi:tRNA-2-methylthio-N6-dimethylallyladenosine synthase
MSDELINTMAHCSKVCRHLHLPIQAGDDEILKKMNRHYTVSHYKNLIKKVRQAMPGIAVSTDVIVGFPGENEKQFAGSKKLFKDVKFDMAYLAQYSSRPGTEAAKLPDNVSVKEKKQREEILNNELKKTALNNNKAYLNKVVKVLVEEQKKEEWFGRTDKNKVVRLKSAKNIKLGEFVNVKIDKIASFGLEGKIIKNLF